MQWRLLRRRGPLRSFTVVGDLAQSAAEPPAADWTQALGALTDEFRLERLTVNYRTPQEIAAARRVARAARRPARSPRPDPSVRASRRCGCARRVAGCRRPRSRRSLADRARGDGGVARGHRAGRSRAACCTTRCARGSTSASATARRGSARPCRCWTRGRRRGSSSTASWSSIPTRSREEAGPGSLYVALTRPTRRLVVIEPGDRRPGVVVRRTERPIAGAQKPHRNGIGARIDTRAHDRIVDRRPRACSAHPPAPLAAAHPRRARRSSRSGSGRRSSPCSSRPRVLYLWALGDSGDANSFYAAAVQAGSESWKAWFFGSLDSSNFITVDKPPACLWVMGLSARIFGFSSWSLLAPQALRASPPSRSSPAPCGAASRPCRSARPRSAACSAGARSR